MGDTANENHRNLDMGICHDSVLIDAECIGESMRVDFDLGTGVELVAEKSLVANARLRTDSPSRVLDSLERGPLVVV